MSLILCRECKQKVSSKAQTCPHCGIDKPAKVETNWKTIIYALTGFAIFLFAAVALEDSNRTPSPPKTPEQTRKETIEKSFSAWDGSHYNLERAIKKSMNDPKSYEHVKTIYWDKDNHLIIQTTFRGKNAFGGTVLNEVTAKADLNGNITEIISQSP